MAIVINLTPHVVSVVSNDGNIIASFPSQGVARAAQKAVVIGDVNGIELASMTFGSPQDLPDPQMDTFFIVSALTANAAKVQGRPTDDLLITADPVRDAEGRVVGCRRFAIV